MKILTRISAFALVSLCVLPAQAQLLEGFGIKVGPVLSNVRYENSPIDRNTQDLFGYSIYVFTELFPASRFSVVSEVGYARRGFSEEFEGRDAQNNPTGLFTIDTRTDYLNVVVLAQVYVMDGAVRPYLLAGPHLGYLLNGSDDDVIDEYSDLAFGGVIGLGAKLPVSSRWSPTVELRYMTDLSDSLPDFPVDVSNRAVELVVGVSLSN